MFEIKASDLILTSGTTPQFRVNGVVQPIPETEILNSSHIEKLLSSVLNDEQMGTFKRNREFDTSFGIEGLSRFRLNAYFQRGSMSIAIRLVPFDIPDIRELGLPSIVSDFIERPNGLILVSGPTGSGKSTTLSAMIEYINARRRCHIITVEDPIEFIHAHKKSVVDQREVGTDTNSFQEALRHILRETPDVIMIGEMRDLDTIRTALTLAETGHLILATLHTHSASHSITRIIDVFPPSQQQQIRIQLSEVLVGVIVQVLVPKRDKKGLILAAEVMNVTGAIRNLIRENSTHQIYMAIQTGSEYGMATLNSSLRELVSKGLVDEKTAIMRSNDSKELKLLLQQENR